MGQCRRQWRTTDGRSLGGLTPVTVRRLSRPGLAWRSAPRCRSRTAEQRFCPSAYVRKTRRALSQLRWRVRPGATYRCGACVGQGPDNAHGKSIIETKNAAGYGRVDTCDNGRLRRRTFAMSPLRSAIARCTSNAQRTASTTLANSANRPSPVFFTVRPLCSLIFGSTNSRRCDHNIGRGVTKDAHPYAVAMETGRIAPKLPLMRP
jgi:hypothetical protein